MSRVIRQETDGTFAYTTGGSAWTNLTTLWGSLGANVKYASVATAICTITLPATHGFTGAALIGYGTAIATTNAVIAVDGVVVQAAWNQKFGTLDDVNYYQPRILSLPITLNPAKGTTQVITLTAGADGGRTSIDGIELFTAEAQVSGRLTSFGHSLMYGVTSNVDGTPRSTTRFTKKFANHLGLTGYLGQATWTDDNQCVPGEDLTNGSYWAGNSPSYPQFTNTRYYNVTATQVPGWMRAECMDTGSNGTHGVWPTTAPGVGPQIIPNFISSTNYYQGVQQWAGRKFAVGMIMDTFNDANWPTIYETGSWPISGTNANTGFRDAASHTTAPSAGTGFSLAVMAQRTRDLLTRAMLNITPAPRIYLIGSSNYNYGGPIPLGDVVGRMDALYAQIAAESWTQSVYYIPLFAATTGLPVGISTSPADFHLNDLGHQAAADAIIRVHQQLLARASTMGGASL